MSSASWALKWNQRNQNFFSGETGRSKGFSAAPTDQGWVTPGNLLMMEIGGDEAGENRLTGEWRNDDLSRCCKQQWSLLIKTICFWPASKAHLCAREAVTWHPSAIWATARVPAAEGECGDACSVYKRLSSIIPFSVSTLTTLSYLAECILFRLSSFILESFQDLHTPGSASKKTLMVEHRPT